MPVHLLPRLLASWIKETFLSNQPLSLKYWLSSGKQLNLRSVTQGPPPQPYLLTFLVKNIFILKWNLVRQMLWHYSLLPQKRMSYQETTAFHKHLCFTAACGTWKKYAQERWRNQCLRVQGFANVQSANSFIKNMWAQWANFYLF